MRLWGRETTRELGTQGTEASGEAVADVLRLAADRIDEIVDAAERAANEIGAAASERLSGPGEPGGQITRERIVAELSESLVKRANDLRAEAGALADVLTRASGRLAAPSGESGSASKSPAPVASKPQPTPKAAEVPEVQERSDLSARVSERFREASEAGADTQGGKRVPFKRRARAERPSKPDSPRPSHDGLRLLATQMAVAGSTREEIEDRLRSEFGVEDPSSVFANQRVPGA